MKTFYKKILVLPAIGLFGLIMCFIPGPKEKTSNLRAGAVKVNITPKKPILMSGYGNRTEPFKGVHDSIYATATVFDDGNNRTVILTADLIGFSHDFCKAAIKKIETVTGIKSENIMLSANHNHGGPVNKTYGDGQNTDVDNYVNELQQNIVGAVQQAITKLQPIKIGMGVGACTMNINRRARFADGAVWLGRNPDGPCDHDVTVIRIDDMDGKPLALFVNWPCHGTVSGQDNYLITGDWPGSAARYVEKAFEGNIVVPVTAGASADINPIYGPGNSYTDIDAIGMLVGEEVVRVAGMIETKANGKINANKITVMANGKKPLESRFPNQKLESGDPVEINLSAMKIGSILIAGVSGELMTEIGMRIKEESPYKNTMIITHCNGSSGYLCTNQAYPEGGYEVMVSRTMPGTEYLISDNLKKMIQSLE